MTATREMARAIIVHLTGRPDEPTPMLMKMLEDFRGDTDQPSCKVLLRRVLDAIQEAEKVGCIDHLDCWDGRYEQWYGPIDAARRGLGLGDTDQPPSHPKAMHDTDPEAARIIDALVVRLAFPERQTRPNVDAYVEAIEYLLRVRREHPEHRSSPQLWALASQYGLIT